MLNIGIHKFVSVTKKTEKWTGFEVELWDQIARRQKIEYSFTEEEDFEHLLKQTENGVYGMSLAGITRTIKRASNLRMSFHTLDTGLTIGTKRNQHLRFKDLLMGIFSQSTMRILALLIFSSAFFGHLYWLVERGNSVSAEYSAGILESFWWSVVTFSTVGYGDISPITTAGVMLGIVSILIGLAIFGLYLGQINSSLGNLSARTNIRNRSDLAGKRVGVKKSTTSVRHANDFSRDVQEFSTFTELMDAFRDGHIDAVVADEVVIKSFSKTDDIISTGGLFARQSYSFIFPKDTEDELIDRVNESLIEIHSDGTYDELYEKYFGE